MMKIVAEAILMVLMSMGLFDMVDDIFFTQVKVKVWKAVVFSVLVGVWYYLRNY